MVAANFDPSLRFVLVDEGGNDDDPDDSGGRTSRGITQREYNAWCTLHRSPHGDVWKASDDTIRAIYHEQYWMPYCDALPKGLDYVYFDLAVNEGMVQATKHLQRALGVDVDGHFGVLTMAAVRDTANVGALIDKVVDDNVRFYENLARARPKDKKFLRGWLNRTEHVRKNAKGMLG